MCGPTTSLEYSPRRPVAVTMFSASQEGDGPTNAGGGGGPTAGTPLPSGPNADAFRRNLRVPMPLGRKVRLVIKNTAIKIGTLHNCCGHPGEPGC
jgi:hypothetical protein